MQVVVGSNPTGTTLWSVHLGVRIQGFHPCHTGSNPVPTTEKDLVD